MSWFRKNKENTKISITQSKAVEPVLQGYYAGLESLAVDYYYSLPDTDRVKLPLIFMDVTGQDASGLSITQAVQMLNIEQLKLVQQLIEKDYKITRH